MVRLRRWLLGLGVVLAVAFVVATLALFVWPRSSSPERLAQGAPVDGLLVLGGGGLTRIDGAIATVDMLVDAGRPSPALLLSVPYGAPYVGCGQDPDRPAMEVLCLAPVPYTTSGETNGLFGTMREQGWERVGIVTSTHHLTRARILADRCGAQYAPGTTIEMVDAGHDAASLRGVWEILTEWPSLLAVPFDAPCPDEATAPAASAPAPSARAGA